LELWHDGLKKHRLIRGETAEVVKLKAKLQVEEWSARWTQVVRQERERSRRHDNKRQAEERKATAANRSAEAQEVLDSLAAILAHTLVIDDAVDWETLKDRTPFPEARPKLAKAPPAPTMPAAPREPQQSDPRYQPRFGILDRLVRSRRERLFVKAMAEFEADRALWAAKVAKIEREHYEALEAHQEELARLKIQYDQQLALWTAKRSEHVAAQDAVNRAVDEKRGRYEAGDPGAIKEYCDLVLSRSRYPEFFPQEFDLEYIDASKTLVVDYVLPAPEVLPTLRAVKYLASKDELEEQHLSDAQAAKLYDEVLYQVVLRTVHELFEADRILALTAVVINGIVTSINRATGKSETACVLSLRAGREEFSAINLAQIDPRACFKALKGVAAAKLYGLSPVPPIMPLEREDERFVSSYSVADKLNEGVNLAAMDWEDFEHLIRELFEKEFTSSGGEVRVTRASRDGGVDAVAFDPDPIRGGKIVIQAKRYTSTVGVSAVRDLYGTVLNEGATKGILVTTSDYGADSYSFANGKPLVLLSGANLLHLLQKHGRRARIDLKEAKGLSEP